MNTIFSELDDRLSTVKRWQILRTIRIQSVAEHCFNVQRIAVRIAQQWFNIEDNNRLFYISQYALHHDDEEAITGDIPSPAKKYVVVANIEKGIDWGLSPWYTGAIGDVKNIVKLADLMEAYRFLQMELSAGNYYVKAHAEHMKDAIVAFVLRQNWKDDIMKYASEWMTEITNERSKVYD